ncbi:MAG: sugar phosphate isomerase/epimerase family protein [Planctomycetaceae bacterium]
MIQSAVTISLVSQAKGGPFVFWDDLAAGFQKAAQLGYDAVELFLPGPDAVDPQTIHKLSTDHNLKIAAVGTGAGWVIHKLSLTAFESPIRDKARQFVKDMIDFGGQFGAPAIIGSMQGRFTDQVPKETALKYLSDALCELGPHAAKHNIPLIYEPLNRYETNLCVTMDAGVALLESSGAQNVKLLADLFHMNIEETNLADALRAGGSHIGHVHFVDSNRRPAGHGHMDYTPIAAALKEIGYEGYASAEAFPWPSPEAAAETTINSFRQLFR